MYFNKKESRFLIKMENVYVFSLMFLPFSLFIGIGIEVLKYPLRLNEFTLLLIAYLLMLNFFTQNKRVFYLTLNKKQLEEIGFEEKEEEEEENLNV